MRWLPKPVTHRADTILRELMLDKNQSLKLIHQIPVCRSNWSVNSDSVGERYRLIRFGSGSPYLVWKSVIDWDRANFETFEEVIDFREQHFDLIPLKSHHVINKMLLFLENIWICLVFQKLRMFRQRQIFMGVRLWCFHHAKQHLVGFADARGATFECSWVPSGSTGWGEFLTHADEVVRRDARCWFRCRRVLWISQNSWYHCRAC